MEIEEIELGEKTQYKYVCKKCNFKCSYLSDWNKHLATRKHKSSLNGNSLEKMEIKINEFICNCGKKYTTNSGLWKHNKKCNDLNKTEDPEGDSDNFKITTQMFYDLLKQNNELQKSLIEIAKEKAPINSTNTNSNSNNNTTNCNNKIFNLQVYLNETCKDAINLTEFVDSIKVQIKDLEKVGEKGYSEGVSKIFIDNLNQLQKKLRPIHCSDSKRETIYIKENNQWTKDDDNKTILTKAIKQVANKNIKKITDWQKLNPEYKDSSSKQNDRYLKIVLNSMSGSTKEEAEKNYEKIIKNVIKETIIDK